MSLATPRFNLVEETLGLFVCLFVCLWVLSIVETFKSTPGRSRKNGAERIDKGLKRQTTDVDDDNGSIQGWLRKRRREVGKAVEAAGDLDWDLAGLEGGAEWTQDHEDEKQFQKDKQNKQMLEAIEYGTIDADDELEAMLAERKKRDAEQDKRLIADRRRRERASNQTKMELDWESWAGKSVWVESSTEDLTRSLQNHGLVVTEDRWGADVFVVQDAAEPPERVRWIASLLGKILVDHAAVQGKGGMILFLKPARQTRLKLHVTRGFQNGHSVISDLVKRAWVLYFCSSLFF